MKGSPIARLWGPGGVRLAIGDAVVLGMLGALVLSLFRPGAAGGRPAGVAVEVSGRTATVLDLARDAQLEVAGPIGATRIEVRSGRARVLASPCAGQSCRHGGWIGTAGEMLVCLPNQVVVRVAGSARGAPDAVTR